MARRGTADSTSTSLMGRSTGQSSFRGSLSSEDDHVLKVEVLKKQGGRIKSWHSRYFVLRRTGVFYYTNEDAYNSKEAPLGRILFCDMISLTGKDSVAEVLPRTIYVMLGMKFVFCVNTDSRTYTIAAPSKESQLEWAEEINEAYTNFHSQFRKKDRLLGAVWKVGNEEIMAQAKQLIRGGNDVDYVVEGMLDTIEDQFAAEVYSAYLR